MHQYKELMDDIKIKYIEMPDKLECLIIGNDLYINKNLSSSTSPSEIKEPMSLYHCHCHDFELLIPLNQIKQMKRITKKQKNKQMVIIKNGLTRLQKEHLIVQLQALVLA